MKIAAIGDVHGNLPALEVVLAHIQAHKGQEIWNVGDFVGYGPFPDEVVKVLRKEASINILGNYDRKTLKVKKKRKKWEKTKAPEKWLAFLWAYEHLSKESRQFLRSLPETKRLKAGDWRVLVVHGSPADPDEYLTPATPVERLEELAAMAEADLVVCGHSHQPFVRQVNGVWFINTGTVGRPDDGDPRACYALLDLKPKKLEVTYHRLPYDIERTVEAIRKNGLPEDFARMMLEGRPLEVIQGDQSPEEETSQSETDSAQPNLQPAVEQGPDGGVSG
jgi:putative phosphoesterase